MTPFDPTNEHLSNPDVVVDATIFCALCGGDVSPERALHLYDEMQDIADTRREARFGEGL